MYYNVCVCVFPRCPSPQYKELLDALLSDSEVDRSMSDILNFSKIYSRVRQVSVQSAISQHKVLTYRDMIEEDSSHSIRDNCSEYNLYVEMSDQGVEMIAKRRKKVVLDREARLLAKRSRARKSVASGNDKGKGVSSMTANVVAEGLTVQPVARATPVKGKIYRSPASYDVEKLSRWKPPLDIDEGVRAELGNLPKLPILRECPNFGVLGIGPKFASHVVAPYMKFAGDMVKLSSQSSSDIFDSMLESTTNVRIVEHNVNRFLYVLVIIFICDV